MPRRALAAAAFALGVAWFQSSAYAVKAQAAGAFTAGLYVSPSGSDRNPGTRSHPVRTLAHAELLARNAFVAGTGSVKVYLQNGEFRLSAPLVFTPSDAPRSRDHLTWDAAPGAKPVITGDERITGWTQTGLPSGAWTAAVPAGFQTLQLYVNGSRASLDSGPPPAGMTQTSVGYLTPTHLMEHWRNPSQILFVYQQQLGQMVEPICPVASIRGRLIRMAEPCYDNSTRRTIASVDPSRSANLVGYGSIGIPTSIENAYPLLANPGQFYVDGGARRIYYIPRHGQNMHTADVEAPTLQTLVEGSGTAQHPLNNITFQGIEFSGAGWLQPVTPDGFSEVQSGYTLTGTKAWATEGLCTLVAYGSCPYGSWTREPAAVEFGYDRGISFIGDTFEHLGGAGLSLDDGTQDAIVSGNVFTDISGNGMEIGDVDLPTASEAQQVSHITITNNHVDNIGVDYPGAVGILVGYTAYCSITHNQLDELPYTGISIGWGGWLDKIGKRALRNYSRNDVIADNLVFDYMQTLADGGGIYTQGPTGPSFADGLQVDGNVIFGQLNWSYALKADDGASYVTYQGNVTYNDDYEFGSPHHDYGQGTGGRFAPPYLPLRFLGNYWQSGYPDMHTWNMTVAGNHLITGPSQAPAAIIAIAGIEASDPGALKGTEDAQLPLAPTDVAVLYSAGNQAYVSWHPGLADTNEPVTSYTVRACPASTNFPPTCTVGPSATITADNLATQGYAVVSGLEPGEAYVFEVWARNSHGWSPSSIPSSPIPQGTIVPALPAAPINLRASASSGDVALTWNAPAPCGTQPWPGQNCVSPILGYDITITDKAGTTVYSGTSSGLSELVLSNTGSHALSVVGGLTAGTSYSATVAAVTPAGTGPTTVPAVWVQTQRETLAGDG